MRFLWNPPSLEGICRSQGQLMERWPARWRDIQLLLTYTANALTVGELRTLRALHITPRVPLLAGQESGLIIRHEEIEMSATLLTAEGKGIILHPSEDAKRMIDSVGNLRINGFAVRSRSAKRNAS